MITAKSIREKADKDLAELRQTCKHDKISKWMGEEWAPAHSTGFTVQVCEICEKILHRRTLCFICHKLIQDDNIISGYEPGSRAIKLPLGASYCKTCVDRSQNEEYNWSTKKWSPRK